MHKKRALKSPFVMTVAASASLLACSGSADTGLTGNGTGSALSTNQPAGGGAAAPTAPAPTTPAPTATAPAPTVTGTVTSHNPPPPPPTCPTSQPEAGSPCADGLVCSFPSGNACPGPTATCDPNTKTWMFSITSCNPPPPICPDQMPADGASCDVAMTCRYPQGVACGGVFAACDPIGKKWQLGTQSCNPPAPPLPPSP
jgi:hypothetical protein